MRKGSVIKRTIRDLYSKDINEIIVEGEAGFKEAKEYENAYANSFKN